MSSIAAKRSASGWAANAANSSLPVDAGMDLGAAAGAGRSWYLRTQWSRRDMYSSGVMSLVLVEEMFSVLVWEMSLVLLGGMFSVLVRDDGARGSVLNGDAVFLLRVLGLLSEISAKAWFLVVFVTAEMVGVIGRFEIGSEVFTSDPSPVFKRTIIDCSMALPCFADAGVGFALDDPGMGFALDDDGRDGCFVCLAFGRLAGLLPAFCGVSSTTISLCFFWPAGSLVNGSSLLGGINWVSVSGAVAGRSGLSYRVIEDGNGWA